MYAFRNVVNIQGSLRKVAVNQQETKKRPHCNWHCQILGTDNGVSQVLQDGTPCWPVNT